MKLMVYDAEIKHAIPERGRANLDGIQYCDGWGDRIGMGVSVICAYVWGDGYRVFLEDNFEAFKTLAEDPNTLCIGFNNRIFDDLLVRDALGVVIDQDRSFDLLRAVRVARGDNPSAPGRVSLDTLCKANFLPGKSGSGAFAPILWQKGKRGQVIDYCLNDVMQTTQLIELVMTGRLRDPENGRILPVTIPGEIVREDVA
jgi:hypothetical protein